MTQLTFQDGGIRVHVYNDDVEAVFALDEAQRRGIALTGPYSALYHEAHTTPGEDHIHVYMKNNELFALNIGGTAHHHSHGVRIPNRVVKAIQKHFPNVALPKDNIIESISLIDEIKWLTEEANS